MPNSKSRRRHNKRKNQETTTVIVSPKPAPQPKGRMPNLEDAVMFKAVRAALRESNAAKANARVGRLSIPRNPQLIPEKTVSDGLRNIVNSQRMNNAAKSLALNVVLPGNDIAPARLSFPYETFETAVARPHLIMETTWDNNPDTFTSHPQLTVGQTFIGVSRNPLQATIRWEVNHTTPSMPGYYYGKFPWDTVLLEIPKNSEVSVRPELFTATAPAIHGPTYYAVDIDGHKAFYTGLWSDVVLPGNRGAGLSIFMTVSNFGLQYCDDIKFFKHYWNGSSWESAGEFFFGFTAGNLDYFEGQALTRFAKSGYHRIVIAFNPSSGNTASYAGLTLSEMVLEVTDRQLAFGVVPWMDNLVEDVSHVRIIGASAILTQTSTVLTKGGRVVGAQFRNRAITDVLPSSEEDFDLYAQVAKQPGFKSLPLETGMYGFHRPIEIDEVKMTPVNTLRKVDGFSTFHNPLVRNWMVICAAAPANSEASATAQIGFSFSLEFVTPNLFFDAARCDMSPGQAELVFDAVSRLPQFHENPLHFKELWLSLKGMVKKFLNAAPMIAPAVSAISGVPIPAALPGVLASLSQLL